MRISPLQKYEPKDWSGLTTENHLGALFGTQPHVISNLLENIFDVNLGTDLDRFMDQFPKVEIPDDEDWEWFLQGQSQKNIPLIGAYADLNLAALPAKPGIGVSRFVLEFPERLFVATDVLVGELDTETLFMQVKIDPVPNGTNWLYEVELITGDSQLFVPSSHLATGLRFSKDYSATEQTLSKRGGSVTHTSPFRMQNRCSMIRKNYEVPGNMISKGVNKPLAFSFKDPVSGKISSTWLSKLDWDFLNEFRSEKARLLMYAQPNRTSQGTYLNKGESGYEIKMGAGLLAQVAPSNVFYYNKFSVKLLMDVLMSLSYGKLPEDKRKFVLGTGEYGWIQFHEEVEKMGLPFSANNAGNRVTGTGQNLRVGGQFTSVGLLQGIEVTLMKIPHFDDIIREKQLHPDGGTMRSREYLIMDFGTTAGKHNIQKVCVKGNEETYGYIPGMRDPFNPYNNLSSPQMRASKVDGYEVFKAYWGGVQVNNPMRMARLIPAFQ
jgi:hypothetical protein